MFFSRHTNFSTRFVVSLLVCCWGVPEAATADGSGATDAIPLGLQSYEPSAFGYTKNNDDVAFENFKLSVKFPLLPGYWAPWLGRYNSLYFSFT